MRIEQPGPDKFTELSDVPHTYVGSGSDVVSVKITEDGLEFVPGGPGGATAWGTITGTLSAQTDLQSALDAKQATLVSGTNIKTINGTTLLGSGDITISGGSFTLTETEIDFGSTPTTGSDFTITNASITAASKIMVTPSGNPATGRVGNDYTWESFTLSALAGTGQFVLSALCSNGFVVGKRKVFYSFS